MRILITGASGYIGKHLASKLLSLKHELILTDTYQHDFYNKEKYFFLVGDIRDKDFVRLLFKEQIDVLVHLAALKSVVNSIKFPTEYFEVNCLGTSNLKREMELSGIRNLIFASSAAVYGNTLINPLISEVTSTLPINPYGESKLRSETELLSSDLNVISARFFNVAGSLNKELVDPGRENIIPIILRAKMQNELLRIFKSNTETVDGTCVRDYIHVLDVVEFISIALEKIVSVDLQTIVNIGSGVGTSTLQLINLFEEKIGEKLSWDLADSREGEAAKVIADVSKAKEQFGWNPKKGIEQIVESALFAIN